MEDQRILETFKQIDQFYRKVKKIYAETGYEKTYPLGGHWLRNFQTMIDFIDKVDDPLEKIAKTHETVMYSLTISDEEIKRLMCDWYVKFFESKGMRIEDLPEHFVESEYSKKENTFEYKGRLVSTDFLHHILTASEIDEKCDFDKDHFFAMELGAGYGALARTLKLFYPQMTLFISDLPETMYFNSLFLSLNFPDAKFCFVTGEEDLEGDLSQYDFIFVPTKFADLLKGQKISLFYNTASMGEMRNEVIRYWINFIQNVADVQYFFGLNRYINTINFKSTFMASQ